MDKFQATFEVLHLLAVIDLELHGNEVSVINDYIAQNYGKGNYDTNALARSLNALSPEGRLQELARVAHFLDSVCSAQDKINILDFALKVVIADRRLTDYETSAFVALGDVWKIDVKKFIDAR
jgi:uncharacterized tellurite resistance protein B-like protein